MLKPTPARRLFGVLVFCGGLAGPLPAAEPDPALSLQKEAINFYRAGDYEQAAERYRRIVSKTPNDPEALRDFLRVLWLAGRSEEAASVATRLIAVSPNDFDGWNTLWQALLAMGRPEQALEALEKCRALAPDKKELELSQARLEMTLKNYDAASHLLTGLEKRSPEYTDIYPELAQVQFIQEAYADSARSWGRAVGFFPNEEGYRFHHAEALYYAGSTSRALREMEPLAAQQPAYLPALNFLVDDAVASQDLSRARRLLNDHLKELGNEGFLRLASVEMRSGLWDPALADAARCLETDPANGEALFVKAECLLRQGHPDQAAVVFEDIVKTNPWSLRGLAELADAYDAEGKPQEALDAIQEARAINPTDPGLVLLESQYLFAAGQYDASQKRPQEWREKNKGPILVALLYHGLTSFDRDPLLASPIHRKTAVFESQIRALKKAGYTPVTAEEVSRWYAGKGTLPPHPVLVTFDDALLNSLRRADPILKKYGYQATMFVPLSDIEGSRPAYASWKDLEGYQKTGRWELEDHGDQAHAQIPIGQGRQGLFLVNKKWIEKENRFETDEEWSERVGRDHEESRRKMKDHLGIEPTAFAFPEGDFGQESIPNFPGAAPKNIEAARKAFLSSYYQDQSGLNTKGRDPALLARFSPPPEWTGKDLLRHIQSKNPFILIDRQLLHQALWAGKIKDAEKFLGQEKEDDGSDPQLWSDEARIQQASGNPRRALLLAQKSYHADPSEENKKLLDEISREPLHAWKPQVTYWEDNRNRHNLLFEQTLGDWKAGDLSWGVKHLFGRYDETGFSTVLDNAAGLTGSYPLSTTQHLGGEALGHWLTDGASNTYSAIGRLESQWTDTFRTDLRGGHTIAQTADTASALANNITETFAQLSMAWTPDKLWKLATQFRSSSLSDSNQYYGGTLEASRRLGFLAPGGLEGLYRFTGATTDHVSPFYYSPQTLQVHQVGFGYTYPLSKRIDWDVRFLTGPGKESNVDWQWVNDVETGLACQLTARFWIKPAFAYDQTPTYRRDTTSLFVNYEF